MKIYCLAVSPTTHNRRLRDQGDIRAWRMYGHGFFDNLWKNQKYKLTRPQAYQELANKMGIAFEQCHFSMFDIDQIKLAIEASKQIIKERNEQHLGRFATHIQNNIPEPIGSVQIPSNHIRLYHYTKGNPEDIRISGLNLSFAKGSTYGEPNMIWASSIPPDPSTKNIVEFHVPIDDQMSLERPQKGQTPEDWMSGNHHVGFYRDIRPDEIIAVHEPWHKKYHYIMKNPDVIERIKQGEFDDLTEDRFPDDYKAIQAIKRQMI